MPGSEASGRTVWLAALGVLVINVMLIHAFHDKAWLPNDDGHYAHVADRMARGEIHAKDVEELHPGYVHWVHALAVKWFGRDFVSLRYPLALALLIQSLVMFWLFAACGPLLHAVVAALMMTALGAFQIATPTANLYCVLFTVLIVAVLVRVDASWRGRHVLLGFLVMLAFLFRQLTGVFLGMGTLTCLLLEDEPQRAPRAPRAPRDPLAARGGAATSPVLARLLMLVMLAGLVGYLLRATVPSGLLLFGLWPLGVLWFGLRRTRQSSRHVGSMVGRLLVGGGLALAPLVAYHLWHGSLGAWAEDSFVRALSLQDLEQIRSARLGRYVIGGLHTLVQGPDLSARLNGFYWVVLPLLTIPLGAWTCWQLARRSRVPAAQLALPVLALFHALVGIFHQRTYYLYLGVGLTVCALLLCTLKSRARPLALVLAVLLGATGIRHHAGQPYTRSIEDVVTGQRAVLVESKLARRSLWVSPEDEALFGRLVHAIRSRSREGQPIFVLPNSAELYLLADRPNPFRLFNPAISLLDEAEVDAFLLRVREVDPVLVVHCESSRYNTDLTDRLLRGLLQRYDFIETIDEFVIYGRSPRSPRDGG